MIRSPVAGFLPVKTLIFRVSIASVMSLVTAAGCETWLYDEATMRLAVLMNCSSITSLESKLRVNFAQD